MKRMAVLCILACVGAGGAAAGTPAGTAAVDQVGQAARAIQAPSAPAPGMSTPDNDTAPAEAHPQRQAAQRGLRTQAGSTCSAFDLLLDRPC